MPPRHQGNRHRRRKGQYISSLSTAGIRMVNVGGRINSIRIRCFSRIQGRWMVFITMASSRLIINFGMIFSSNLRMRIERRFLLQIFGECYIAVHTTSKRRRRGRIFTRLQSGDRRLFRFQNGQISLRLPTFLSNNFENAGTRSITGGYKIRNYHWFGRRFRFGIESQWADQIISATEWNNFGGYVLLGIIIMTSERSFFFLGISRWRGIQCEIDFNVDFRKFS